MWRAPDGPRYPGVRPALAAVRCRRHRHDRLNFFRARAFMALLLFAARAPPLPHDRIRCFCRGCTCRAPVAANIAGERGVSLVARLLPTLGLVRRRDARQSSSCSRQADINSPARRNCSGAVISFRCERKGACARDAFQRIAHPATPQPGTRDAPGAVIRSF